MSLEKEGLDHSAEKVATATNEPYPNNVDPVAAASVRDRLPDPKFYFSRANTEATDSTELFEINGKIYHSVPVSRHDK